MRVTVMMVLAMGLGAQICAQGTSGRLVVLNKDDAMLVTVDVASGKILGRVATGEGPHEVGLRRRTHGVRCELRDRSGAGPHDLGD
jgi:hypothetical protein